jgi:alpha-L-rhamnosidase
MNIGKFFFCVFCGVMAATRLLAGASVEQLRCEGWENPLGIDAPHPRLSWAIRSDVRGQKQTAYQVLVASSSEKLEKDQGDLWDSGKVTSDQSIHVRYAGAVLASRAQCFWKVRVWVDRLPLPSGERAGVRVGARQENGDPTPWSAPASWTMGLFKFGDWKGSWITASRWFMPPEYRPIGWTGAARSWKAETPSWAQVDLGQPLPIDKVRLVAHTRERFPLQFRIETDDHIDFPNPQLLAECAGKDYELADSGVAEFPGNGRKARFVRLFLLKSPSTAKEPKLFQSIIRQMEVWSGGKNAALMRPALDSGGQLVTFMFDGMPSANDGERCPDDACPTHQAPLLRKSFSLEKPVKRAMLYYAAHGMAEVSLNGRKVDDTVLGPPFTDYSKRIVYRTVEVTDLLAQGENVLGALLGNGFFSPPNNGMLNRHNGQGQPRFLANLEIELADGTKQQVVSDESWKWARSEIVNNDLWTDYHEDRAVAKPGWDKPGYADTGWRNVGLAASLGGKLCAPDGPPARVMGEVKPVRIEGSAAIFETHNSGWPKLIIKNGKAGQKIQLGGFHRSTPRISFTLAEDGPAVLEPKFIYVSGPIKLSVVGLKEPLTPETICIRHVRADLRQAGDFHCSNPFLNELHAAVRFTHLNYVLDHPLDPMREKQGWTQDAENMFNTAAYLTDVEGMYRKWWRDMADNQVDSGLVGSVVPEIRRVDDGWNNPWWSGMVVWLPWEHYLYYGDESLLKEAYEPMRKYVDFLDRLAAHGAGARQLDFPDLRDPVDAKAAAKRQLMWQGANDWCGNPKWMFEGTRQIPGPLLSMTAWQYYADIVSKTAGMTDRAGDVAKYAAMAADVRQRINERFLTPATGLYAGNTNCMAAQLMPLALGVTPEATRPLTYQRMMEAIHAYGDHHACGFVTLPYLLRTLTDNHETALANRIVNQEGFPSWRTLMHDGALFENWKGGDALMPSCGGIVGMWLYQSVLGIRPDPAGPGFKRFILAPQPDPATGLTSAEGWFDSPHGRIVSKWKIADGKLTMEAGIPANTVATVRIPTTKPESVQLDGQPVAASTDVKILRSEPNAVLVEVGGGAYVFTATGY